MCIAIPMKLVEVKEANRGTAELNGTKYNVELSLVPDAAVGDFLIVHAGFAIEKLDEAEANERLKLFGEMAEMWTKEDAGK